jgi:hypothetical protein
VPFFPPFSRKCHHFPHYDTASFAGVTVENPGGKIQSYTAKTVLCEEVYPGFTGILGPFLLFPALCAAATKKVKVSGKNSDLHKLSEAFF